MQEDHKFRVALGVVDDFTRLVEILSAFQVFGLDAGDAAVLADHGAIDGKLEDTFSGRAGEGQNNAPSVLIRGKSDDGTEVLVSASTQIAHILTAGNLLHFEDWISGKLSDDLNRHLASGACILIVPITSAELEWRVSNALLKHSISAVQLHDLPIPDGAAKPAAL